MSRAGLQRAAAFAGPALLAPLLVLVSTRRDGLGLSPDSVAYLAAADGVASGHGVVGLDGRPQSLYAPGLSWLLALPAHGGFAVGAARALNLVCLAAVVLGLGWVLDRYVRRAVAVTAAGAAAVSAPLLAVHGWLWSEPLYILLSAVLLALLGRIAATGRAPARWVVAAGLVAAAATLVRYAGVSLLPVAVAVLLLRPVPWPQRIRAGILFGVAYAVPVGGWLLRNVALTGDPSGERVANALSVRDVLTGGVTTVARWLTPGDLSLDARLWSTALLVAGVAALAVAARRAGPADPRAAVLGVAAGAVVLSFAVLVAMTAGANVNVLGLRLLSPLVVPLVAALAVSADLVLDRLPRPGRLLCAAAMVGVAAWCLLPATVRQVSAAGEDALSFTRGPWQSADSRDLVAAVPSGATVVSDDPWGVWFLTGRAVSESPREHYHASDRVPPHDLDALRAAVRAGPTYLVWFDRPASDYHLTPADLRDDVELTAVGRTDVGAVYRVTATAGPRPT
ncbi:hypothetical protein [Blastococcus sp. URHD0036]|uniref:hypothetical protein n=1 Tax=Blastococcus sp. URHD0036 TaxID=1380356 RepID=UPI0004976919|nr:hypothetical protein [Blastococcus sp. URHD0036]